MRRQMRPPPRVSPLLQQHFLMDAQVENQQGRKPEQETDISLRTSRACLICQVSLLLFYA